MGAMVNIAAWGLGLGTAFFTLFGLKASKVTCTLHGGRAASYLQLEETLLLRR